MDPCGTPHFILCFDDDIPLYVTYYFSIAEVALKPFQSSASDAIMC